MVGKALKFPTGMSPHVLGGISLTPYSPARDIFADGRRKKKFTRKFLGKNLLQAVTDTCYVIPSQFIMRVQSLQAPKGYYTSTFREISDFRKPREQS
jgi:hypothetical protein